MPYEVGNSAEVSDFDNFLGESQYMGLVDNASSISGLVGWRVASFHPQIVFLQPKGMKYSERYIDVKIVPTTANIANLQKPSSMSIVKVNIFQVEGTVIYFAPLAYRLEITLSMAPFSVHAQKC